MEFKNNKELTAFIFLNLFGSPFAWIVSYIFLNWYGVIGCLAIAYVSYLTWKYYSKLIILVKPNTSFALTWKNVKEELPKEGKRYWCIVEEVSDLGKSYFQWNCDFHNLEKRWYDDGKECRVIWWTELAPRPF